MGTAYRSNISQELLYTAVSKFVRIPGWDSGLGLFYFLGQSVVLGSPGNGISAPLYSTKLVRADASEFWSEKAKNESSRYF